MYLESKLILSFLDQGPFFIDKELILSAIDNLDGLTTNDALDSKYIIGMNIKLC